MGLSIPTVMYEYDFEHLPFDAFIAALGEVGDMRSLYGYEEYLTLSDIINHIIDVSTNREIITSIVYTYTSTGLLENPGLGGEEGEESYDETFETLIGISSSEEVSTTTSTAITASVKYKSILSPVSASTKTTST